MFWKFNLISTSHVETLLSKENVTLKELMDEDDILQECKAQSKKLVDFLVQPEVMDEMVSLITQEPSFELDEVVRYKYSNIACELLTSDVGAINDALAGDQALLSKLLSFLEHNGQDKPLNPLLASFFSKTLSLLITRKTQPMFEFLQGRDEFVPMLLEHLETSAITDLLLRFVTCTENNDSRTALVKPDMTDPRIWLSDCGSFYTEPMLQWLGEQHLVERLVALISPGQSEERNSNAAQALCDIVRVSREHMSLLQEKADPDPLLISIESTETISKLLDNMFGSERKESVLVSGILVVLALLEFKKQGPAGQYQTSGQGGSPSGQTGGQSPESSLGAENPLQCFASLFFRSEGPEIMTPLDAERLAQGVSQVVAALTPRLADFTQLLKEPPQKASYSGMVNSPVTQPVGWTRLEVAHLLSALLNTNTHELNEKLAQLNTIPCLLDLFFHHSWNNFLHTQVEQAIGTILRSAPTSDQEGNKAHPLLEQIFFQCKIVQRILDNWEENEQEQSQPGKHRRGYMGHLTNIANHLVKNSESGPNSELIQSKLKELPEEYSKRWESFATETLAEINKRNQTPLVSGVLSSVLDGDCVDFRDLHVPFQQESALQQAFADYQMQQMTSNFVDQFGFNDDEFVETDESIADRLNRVTGNFQLDTEEPMRSAELFEQTCRERIPSLGDGDSDEEVWDDKEHEMTFASGINPSNNLRLTVQGSSSLDESSSDSEGEDGTSDSSRGLPQPPGVVGMVTTPDSPLTSPAQSATTLNNTSIDTSPVQSRLVQEDLKMEVDSTDAWPSSCCPSEGVAMDTSNPWESAVLVPVMAEISHPPTQIKKPDSQGWADFSCFSTFPSSNSIPVPPVAAMDTGKDNSKSEEPAVDTSKPVENSQSKVESGPVLATPLANGQVPVLASGPVVVVVGSLTPSMPALPEGGSDHQQTAEVTLTSSAVDVSTSPSKISEDPSRTSSTVLLQTGSLEGEGDLTAVVSTTAASSGSPTAYVQNGPV